MSSSSHISRLVAAALTIAALAAPSALADPPQLMIEQKSQGPVRADVDGYQPQLRGAVQPDLIERLVTQLRGDAQPRGIVGPSVGYERPDGLVPQLRVPATVAAAASDGIDWVDATIGAAIGLGLGFVLFASAQLARGRTRIAHS
jgi:hypothetical protein